MKTCESEKPEASDAELLLRVRRGDVEAFAPVVRRHLPSLRAFVAGKLPVPHLADEIAHEAFVFAFRHLQEFDPRRPFRSWLRGIAWNLIRAELQRFAREQVNRSRLEQLQLAERQAAGAEVTPPDEAGFLEECLGELPSHLCRLIEDRYRQGRTTADIAAHWGRTEEWARVTLFRARRQLRACIETKLAGGSHAN